ncbi:hypothetical protein AK830_g11747 [Neonectria ditissima]|uniref:Arsenite methyltransferase n=1 Tax=Neonectria ditissima TaxID=78410 RepID=A0A0P7ALH5_9HYPO|nr:hypothetical protein AK830_g11747 [Neonectria ditissima]
MDSREIYSHVSERYSAAALGSSNAGHDRAVAKAFGYSEEELGAIPREANLGLSCGNPLAVATLREGETVIDLGSGAGLDVFLAASKVGPTGKAIGVDMNKDMLAKAQRLKADSGKANVQFVESRITKIALASGIADCIISNCVINLVPPEEKQQVFAEMFRLLKPGGRVAVSDILAKKPLPADIRRSIDLYVGCVAGASQVAEYERYLENAGFEDVLVTDTESDLNIYLETGEDGGCSVGSAVGERCCSAGQGMATDLQGQDLNQWAGEEAHTQTLGSSQLNGIPSPPLARSKPARTDKRDSAIARFGIMPTPFQISFSSFLLQNMEGSPILATTFLHSAVRCALGEDNPPRNMKTRSGHLHSSSRSA